MARAITSSTGVEQLVGSLFERRRGDPMAAEMATWLAASPRYRTFVDAYRPKIRKKVRGASDAESRRDLRAELRVAALLSADRRLDLAFETHGTEGGPDFTITFRENLRFELEVTRMRRPLGVSGVEGPLLAKLRQLSVGIANVVVVAVDAERVDDVDVAATVRSLRARADAKDDAWFVFHGLDGAKSFYERFLRLGGLIVWSERAPADERAALWLNPSARTALPVDAARACLACLRR